MEEIEEEIREYDNLLKDLKEKVDVWKVKLAETSLEDRGEYLKLLKERQKLREDLDKISHMGRLIETKVSLCKRKSGPPVVPLGVIDKNTSDMLKHARARV